MYLKTSLESQFAAAAFGFSDSVPRSVHHPSARPAARAGEGRVRLAGRQDKRPGADPA